MTDARIDEIERDLTEMVCARQANNDHIEQPLRHAIELLTEVRFMQRAALTLMQPIHAGTIKPS